ncbi:hypothetical protein ACP275_13G027800 [Erythranthe tilingii]
MSISLVQRFMKYIPIRVSRVSINSIRKPFSTKPSVEETLNQILASDVSREEICIGYIRTLCSAGNLLEASRFPQILRSKHIFIGPRAYNYLLEDAGRKNDIETLSRIFMDLLVSCGSVESNSYLIFARAFGKRNDPSALLNFVREVCEMESRVIILNRVIFALGKCGYAHHALMVFDQMPALDCEPDLVTYNTVLAILGRLGRVDEMLRVFNVMKSFDLIPDIFTYNTVLNSLRKMGRLDLCLVHFKEMTVRGIQPDLLTFKDLIESLGRSGNVVEAMKVFDYMKCKGVVPSIYIYRALVFSLKKMGNMESALKLSMEMNKLPRNSVPRDFRYKNG